MWFELGRVYAARNPPRGGVGNIRHLRINSVYGVENDFVVLVQVNLALDGRVEAAVLTESTTTDGSDQHGAVGSRSRQLVCWRRCGAALDGISAAVADAMLAETPQVSHV